jgi:hypothetical protein
VIDQAAINQLRRLMDARVKRDEDAVKAKRSEETYREVEAEVYEAFEDSGTVGTIKADLGEPHGIVSFRTRETYFGKIVDEDAALEYYEQRAQIDEVTQPKFTMARINEEVRDRIEQGQSMPPGVTFTARRGMTITRQK